MYSIDVQRVFDGSFKGVSRKFQGCLKIEGCSEIPLRVIQESFKGI